MEDEWIDAENLYQLWMAEGMVLSSDKREGETMMQVAESYMGELVHRSMIQVRFNDLESSSTKFRSWSLHDLMRDLSLSQAKREDLYEAIDLREENGYHLNRYVVYPFANTRQLVVYHEGGTEASSYFTKKPNHQQYRSILILVEDGFEFEPVRLRSYFANFRLLRVLALENLEQRQTVLGTLFGTNIGRVLSSLVYLRYLSLRGSDLKNFEWVHKLVLLQTLNIDVTRCDPIPVMSSNVLGKLAYLRHLYLPYSFSDDSWNFKLRFNGLSKLETLENFEIRWCEVKDLPKLSGLRRLKLKAVGGFDDMKEMFKYLSALALSSYSCLQYLDLHIDISDQGFKYDPDMIRQLLCNHKFNLQELCIEGKLPELSALFEQQQQQLNLNHAHIDVSSIVITTLVLASSDLVEDPMPVLEKIPTLRNLDLRDGYEGKEMVCSAMGFPKLTRLELYYLPNLEKWRVEEGSMPILQRLTICHFPKLEELPEGLVFLNLLEELSMTAMPSAFCDKIRLKNGKQGPDFYKVAHIPRLVLSCTAGCIRN